MHSHDVNDSTYFTIVEINGSQTLWHHHPECSWKHLISWKDCSASSLLFALVIPSSHPHLNKKKMLWKGKWGERKTLTTQKLSQQWNEHWNIQRGIHVLDSSVLCRLQHTQQLVTVSSATMKPAESSSTARLARLLFKKANASWLESLNSVQLHY